MVMGRQDGLGALPSLADRCRNASAFFTVAAGVTCRGRRGVARLSVTDAARPIGVGMRRASDADQVGLTRTENPLDEFYAVQSSVDDDRQARESTGQFAEWCAVGGAAAFGSTAVFAGEVKVGRMRRGDGAEDFAGLIRVVPCESLTFAWDSRTPTTVQCEDTTGVFR
jgi:hypothetical protein